MQPRLFKRRRYDMRVPKEIAICKARPKVLAEDSYNLQLCFKLRGKPQIVGCQNRDPLASCQLYSPVLCRARAKIRLVHVSDAIHVRRECVRRVVGRPVVNNNDLIISIGLTKDTLDCIYNKLTPVKRRYYNRNRRHAYIRYFADSTDDCSGIDTDLEFTTKWVLDQHHEARE